MKALCLAALASVSLTGFAHAADILPTTKSAPAGSVNCFASLWTYLDSTAADCPLSYGPFTLYATLDAGLIWLVAHWHDRSWLRSPFRLFVQLAACAGDEQWQAARAA